MGKVTSKLQVTLPKAIADRLGIRPGDELDWTVAGSAMQVTPVRGAAAGGAGGIDAIDERLKRFDEATARERARRRRGPRGRARGARGWTRGDLYGPPRGRAD